MGVSAPAFGMQKFEPTTEKNWDDPQRIEKIRKSSLILGIDIRFDGSFFTCRPSYETIKFLAKLTIY